MNGLANVSSMAFILTRDRPLSSEFYRNVLGLPRISEDEFGIVFDLAGVQMRLTTVEDYQPHPHTVLGWQVKDIVSSVRELAGRGVKFTIYPGFGQDELGIWSMPDGSAKVAWFNDPDGNVLSLTQC